MTAKLLQIVLLMSSIALVRVEGDIPKSAFNDDENEIHHKRHLWATGISTAADEGNDVSEDRVINAATIKEMAETGAQIISTATKNLVANTKIAMMQRRTNQLFTRFKVDKVESNLLESMQFKNWAASVSNIYQNTEKSTAAMVVALTNRYGDDTLASMLTSAKEVPDTNEVAVKMLKAQIDNWATLKKPADDVFKILKLDKAGYKLFVSPSWTRWQTYAAKKGVNPYELLIPILIKRFGDGKVAAMLIRSKNGFTARVDRAALEKALYQMWINDGKFSGDVYKLLKLNQEEPAKLLKNPTLRLWIVYKRKREVGDPYEALLSKLAKHFDDEKLPEFIAVSKEVASTSIIASRLDNALPGYWLGRGKTPDDVFTLLKLNTVDKDKLFDSPTWEKWISYLTAKSTQTLVEKNPDEMMYAVLKKHYGKKGVEAMIASAKKNERTKKKTKV